MSEFLDNNRIVTIAADGSASFSDTQSFDSFDGQFSDATGTWLAMQAAKAAAKRAAAKNKKKKTMPLKPARKLSAQEIAYNKMSLSQRAQFQKAMQARGKSESASRNNPVFQAMIKKQVAAAQQKARQQYVSKNATAKQTTRSEPKYNKPAAVEAKKDEEVAASVDPSKLPNRGTAVGQKSEEEVVASVDPSKLPNGGSASNQSQDSEQQYPSDEEVSEEEYANEEVSDEGFPSEEGINDGQYPSDEEVSEEEYAGDEEVSEGSSDEQSEDEQSSMNGLSIPMETRDAGKKIVWNTVVMNKSKKGIADISKALNGRLDLQTRNGMIQKRASLKDLADAAQLRLQHLHEKVKSHNPKHVAMAIHLGKSDYNKAIKGKTKVGKNLPADIQPNKIVIPANKEGMSNFDGNGEQSSSLTGTQKSNLTGIIIGIAVGALAIYAIKKFDLLKKLN